MTDVWEPPKAVVKLKGTITYRCAGCGENVSADDAVLAPLDRSGRLTPETRAYHPNHQQEMNHGS